MTAIGSTARDSNAEDVCVPARPRLKREINAVMAGKLGVME
jgi:hypothetical protein